MKLYYSPGACSLACHIVAFEAGLALELERVDLRTHRTAGGDDYYAIHAKGTVPLLELDDGERLGEQVAISQYLADRAGRTDLLPAAGTMARYRVTSWQSHLATDVQRAFAPFFGAQPPDNATAAAARKDLLAKFARLDAALAPEGGLAGPAFTVAHAHLFVLAGWCRLIGLDLSGLAALGRFLAAAGQRPAVVEAMRAEGLLAAAV